MTRGNASRSAKMKATTPSKVISPCKSAAASGIFPIEQTKLMNAIDGPATAFSNAEMNPNISFFRSMKKWPCRRRMLGYCFGTVITKKSFHLRFVNEGVIHPRMYQRTSATLRSIHHEDCRVLKICAWKVDACAVFRLGGTCHRHQLLLRPAESDQSWSADTEDQFLIGQNRY